MTDPAPTYAAATSDDTVIVNRASAVLTGPGKDPSADAVSSLQPLKTIYNGRGRPKKTDIGQKTGEKRLTCADAFMKQVDGGAKKRKGGRLDEPWKNIAPKNGGDGGIKKEKIEPLAYLKPGDIDEDGDCFMGSAALQDITRQKGAGMVPERGGGLRRCRNSRGNSHTEGTHHCRSCTEPGTQHTNIHIDINHYHYGASEGNEDDKDAEGDSDWEMPILRSHVCHRCQERIGSGGKHSCRRAEDGTWTIQRKGYDPNKVQAEWDEAIKQGELLWDMDLEAKRGKLMLSELEAVINDSGIQVCESDNNKRKPDSNQASTTEQPKNATRKKSKRPGQTGSSQKQKHEDVEEEDEYPFLSKLYDPPMASNFGDRFVLTETSMPCYNIPTFPYNQHENTDVRGGELYCTNHPYGQTWSYTNPYFTANQNVTTNNNLPANHNLTVNHNRIANHSLTANYNLTDLTANHNLTANHSHTANLTPTANHNLTANHNPTPNHNPTATHNPTANTTSTYTTSSQNTHTSHTTSSHTSPSGPTICACPSHSGVTPNTTYTSPPSSNASSSFHSRSSTEQDTHNWTDAAYLKRYDDVMGGLPDWLRE